ncbi:MAG TPA: hypothetical protein VIO84_12175 [Candidatus Dormibacteraeota bacterium]|jgi:cell pole-organizing protein PopZ
MTWSKIVRGAVVAGTGAALVLATGVSASAQNTTAADVTTSTTTVTAAESENFGELLALLAQLPEFQGKTLAQIQAEIDAAIQAQIQADAAADAAAAQADATETDTDTDTETADTDQAEVDDQTEAPKVKTVSTDKTITPPREESRESTTAERHEQDGDRGGHDR